MIIYAIHFVSSVLLAVGSSKGNILSNSNVSAPSVSAIKFLSIDFILIDMIFYFCIGKRKLLIPWMVISVIAIVWCLVAIILNIVLGVNQGVVPVGQIIGYVIGIIIQVYFLVVVYSFHNELKSGESTNTIA